MKYIAYLDIETTGFSPYYHDLTIIGLHLDNGSNEVMQFIGDEICSLKLITIAKKIDLLYTYNGARFDLPFISEKLNVNLTEYCQHKDLMHICWQNNLYGGLKEVERKLGIKRRCTDIDGKVAVKLWRRYKLKGCTLSLDKLLEYNKEDVLNLKNLRKRLIK